VGDYPAASAIGEQLVDLGEALLREQVLESGNVRERP
jgi:hypothetical protein